VNFHSYTEPHLCADNELVRGIVLAVLATMAKQELHPKSGGTAWSFCLN
jgi:hypothetical protein